MIWKPYKTKISGSAIKKQKEDFYAQEERNCFINAITGFMFVHVYAGISERRGLYFISDSPAISEIEPQGANPPSGFADTHDLSVSDYNYQVTNIGYRVYTSKWLTGVSSIKISVSNWKLLEEYHGATKDQLTLRVYNSSKKLVDSKTITIYSGSGSATFSGLSSTSKYYVCFEVPTNSNRYSFDGSIY